MAEKKKQEVSGWAKMGGDVLAAYLSLVIKKSQQENSLNDQLSRCTGGEGFTPDALAEKCLGELLSPPGKKPEGQEQRR